MGEAQRKRERGEAVQRIYEVRITLLGIDPPVWRRVRLDGESTLSTLHEVIQAVMPWEDCHLHGFEAGGARYGPPMPASPFTDTRERDERHAPLRRVAPEGARLHYEYDFGDSWEHDIEIERRLALEPDERYPVCVAGERACPPDDSGGVRGYGRLVEASGDPSDEDHEHAVGWLGEDFDSEAFDLGRANWRLERLRRGAANANGEDVSDVAPDRLHASAADLLTAVVAGEYPDELSGAELAMLVNELSLDEAVEIFDEAPDGERVKAIMDALAAFEKEFLENPEAAADEVDPDFITRLEETVAYDDNAIAEFELPDLPPEEMERLESVLHALTAAASEYEVNSGALEPDAIYDLAGDAIALVIDYAEASPNGFGRAAPEGWAAGALHAASMRVWVGERITAADIAERCDISKATVYSRSRDLRDTVPPEPPIGADGTPHALEAFLLNQVTPVPDAMMLAGADEEVDASELKRLLEPVTRSLDLQVDEEGQFDYERFREGNGIPEEDAGALLEAFARGLEAYYLDIYGYPKWGEGLVWLVDERLGDARPFGYAALAALRDPDLTPETKDAVARYVTGLLATAAADFYGLMPDGNVAALGWLSERGLIEDDALAGAIAASLGFEGALAGVRPKEARPIIRAVGRADAMPEPERADLLARLVGGAGHAQERELGPPLVDAVAEDDVIPATVRARTLEMIVGTESGAGMLIFIKRSARIQAARHLATLAAEPARLALDLLDLAEQSNSDVRYQCAAAMLQEMGEELPAEVLRDAVERGISAGRAQARKPFYELGASRIGEEYRERAAGDAAAAVRKWAEAENAPEENAAAEDAREDSRQQGADEPESGRAGVDEQDSGPAPGESRPRNPEQTSLF